MRCAGLKVKRRSSKSRASGLALGMKRSKGILVRFRHDNSNFKTYEMEDWLSFLVDIVVVVSY